MRPVYFNVFALLLSAQLAAQIDWHPYLGWQFGRKEAGVDGIDGLLGITYAPKHDYLVGVDAYVGKRQLAPFVGIAYARTVYELQQANGSDESIGRLQLPFGIGYRLRPADAGINLTLSAAALPHRTFLPDDARDGWEEEWYWGYRAGAVLGVDYVTLSIFYHIGRDDVPATEENDGSLALALGLRF